LWKVDWPGQSNGPASVSQATQLDTQHLLLSKGYGGGSKLLKFSEKFVEPIEVEQIWHHPSIMKSKFMTPVVSGEYVYGLSDGVLECMRWSDGKKIWKDNRQGRLGHGQMLLVGNQLLCSSEDGRLVLTDATPEKPTSYESLSLLDGITWNPIAIAGDLVLVRNGEQAVCVRVKRE
jgi:outer membrane protein assembly factor BamB